MYHEQIFEDDGPENTIEIMRRQIEQTAARKRHQKMLITEAKRRAKSKD
jgi:hypothetical protein